MTQTVDYRIEDVRRLRNIYGNMIARCHDPLRKHFNRYGGRGIVVCEEWRMNRSSFIDWAMANGYAPNLEIDRRDNDGNYEPGNCRWITHGENMLNQGPRTGKYKGVCFSKAAGWWLAQIVYRRKHVHIGLFQTEEDAARAYDEKARELHGEFAYLNFPGETKEPSRDRPLRTACGERQHSAKLTAEKVKQIRTEQAAGATQVSLASKYGVSPHAVMQVVKRRTWRHIP